MGFALTVSLKYLSNSYNANAPPSRQVCHDLRSNALLLRYSLVSRHVHVDFWPTFAAKAGVFCMGEVFSGVEVE